MKSDPVVPPERIRPLKPFFLALSSWTRLRIVATLAECGEMSVTDLARTLRISQPLVSWHLTRLRQGGILKQRQEGRLAYCSLDNQQIAAYQHLLSEILQQPGLHGLEEGRGE